MVTHSASYAFDTVVAIIHTYSMKTVQLTRSDGMLPEMIELNKKARNLLMLFLVFKKLPRKVIYSRLKARKQFH